jgi:hypothetical protein
MKPSARGLRRTTDQSAEQLSTWSTSRACVYEHARAGASRARARKAQRENKLTRNAGQPRRESKAMKSRTRRTRRKGHTETKKFSLARSLTLEVSGRCHRECQVSAQHRSGPLDRIVRPGRWFGRRVVCAPEQTKPLAKLKCREERMQGTNRKT